MDAKFGIYATTCSAVLALVSGCAPAPDQVARNAGLDPLTLPLQSHHCPTRSAPCDVDRFALLSSPNNVVYTTRAEITPGQPETKDTHQEVMPRSTARDATGIYSNPVLNE